MTRVVDKHGQWQYQFDVLTEDNMVRTYQTIKALSPDRCADSPFDRAMHVFEVQRVTTKGCGDSFSTVDTNTYALQDYWRSDVEGRNSETRSQRKLYGALKAHTSSADELREVWAHFMEFLADGVVRWEDMRACASAPDIPANQYNYEEGGLPSESEEDDAACQSAQEEVSGASAEIASCESCEEGSESNQADNDSVARLRHRTLHAHVCVDLYQVNEPAVFFFALDKAVFGTSCSSAISPCCTCLPRCAGAPSFPFALLTRNLQCSLGCGASVGCTATSVRGTSCCAAFSRRRPTRPYTRGIN